MSPFDATWKSDLVINSRRELASQRAGLKTAARNQATLDRNGPTVLPTAAQREADRVKTANIRKGEF